MNAKFRKGAVYRITPVRGSGVWIAPNELIYTGAAEKNSLFNTKRNKYNFQFTTSNSPQVLPKNWVDKGLVTIEKVRNRS